MIIENKELKVYDFEEIKDKCYGFIYVTKNKINQKKYLGQHTKWNKNYLGSGQAIKAAIKKYGEENFERIIIDIASCQEELDQLETMYINEFFDYCIATSKKWYNIKDGGQHGGNPLAGKTEEELKEFRRKLSESMKGKFAGEKNPMFGKNRSAENNPMFGKHHSNETLRKISSVKKGKYKGENNPFFGKHHSDETRRKMGLAKKGRYDGENNPQAKRVVLYQPQIGEAIGIFGSIKECVMWLSEIEGIPYNTCWKNLGEKMKGRPINPSKKHPVLNKVKAYYYDNFIKLFGEEKLAQFTF